MSSETANHELRPTKPTWTHLALAVSDLESVVAWYEEFTHFEVLSRDQDEQGKTAWLGDPSNSEDPFLLVVGEFFEGKDPFAPATHPPLGPFAHIGIEMPDRESIDSIAKRAEEAGCLALGPMQMPKRVGYICFLKDPEGNTVEYSYDQGVYEKAKEVWG